MRSGIIGLLNMKRKLPYSFQSYVPQRLNFMEYWIAHRLAITKVQTFSKWYRHFSTTLDYLGFGSTLHTAARINFVVHKIQFSSNITKMWRLKNIWIFALNILESKKFQFDSFAILSQNSNFLFSAKIQISCHHNLILYKN